MRFYGNVIEFDTHKKTLPSDKFEGKQMLSYFYPIAGVEYVCKETFELEVGDEFTETIHTGDTLCLIRQTYKRAYYRLTLK